MSVPADEDKARRGRPAVTPSDFVQIVRGTATADVRDRFLDAYNDPTSEIHEVLLGMEEWGRQLSSGRGLGQDILQASRRRAFADRLDEVERFVRQMHAEEVMTANEVERLFDARGPVEPQSTPRQFMAAVARMARSLDEIHPELHGELIVRIREREASQSR
jgi:hypothetical protein